MSVLEGRLRRMTDIALFHSVLGVRPGVTEAADRLRAASHDVLVVDQYDGQTFDDYDEAGKFAQAIGYPGLMRRAAQAVEGLRDGFIAAGFSNGGGMAEFVPTARPVGPGSGHLFTDPSLPAEYDERSAELLWSRVLPFCAAPAR